MSQASPGPMRRSPTLKDQLGYDAAFNYKTTEDLGKSIREVCPDGIDVYFDNVGGPITDAAFWSLNIGARVGICGQISQYNLEKGELGPRPFWHLIVKRATVRGFLVFDYFPRFREATDRPRQVVSGRTTQMRGTHHRRTGERPTGVRRDDAGSQHRQATR